ncbi:MAG: DNA methyltransferase [Micrococcaceae bacterium]
MQLPEYFTKDGEFDLYSFQNKLKSKNVQELNNGYRLDFIGKDYAKKQSGELPVSVIIPDKEHNEQEQNKVSNNLFFTGDNLEVLRHLKSSYYNSIDFIYIDPPYNTGSDGFVYPDKFEYSDEQLKEIFSLDDEELKRLKSIQGKASHSAWLAFMYPRLVLARKLLKETGAMFISIDDNEQASLKSILDDVFGVSSFICNFIWKKKNVVQNDARFVSVDHEYVLCYGKNISELKLNLLPRTEELNKRYSNPDNDPKGKWTSVALQAKSGNNTYKVTFPNGISWEPVAGTYPRLSEKSLMEAYDDGRLWFGKQGKNVPRLKKYLSEVKDGVIPNSVWPNEEVGSTQAAKQYLKRLLQQNVFDTPKPVSLIKRLINLIGDKDALVLDFFAGSATTADAVMRLNAEDDGTRKYIMVQLPEPVPEGSEAAKAGYKSIDEISRARIEKAAAKISEEHPDYAKTADFGFKHYWVKYVDLDTLDKLESFDPDAIIVDNLVDELEGGVDTLLATWMTADGYILNELVEKKTFNNAEAYYIDNSLLYIFDNTWNTESTKALLNAIGAKGKKKLVVNTIVVNDYALNFSTMAELKANLKTLKDSNFNINIEVRG